MAATAGERVFLRKASGLIKTASNTDVFIYDFGLVSVGLGLGFMLFYGPAVYLGGNLYVGVLLAGAAMILVGLGMICWSITIPRSGGIYNYGTRSMWPPFAFTLSFVEVSAWLFYGSFGAVYLAQLGIAPAVTAAGILLDDPGVESFGADLASPWGTFGIASGALIVGAIILASGMRRFFFTQKVMFTIAILGTLVFLGTLLATSRADFTSAFNSNMGPRLDVGSDAYNGVIGAATEAGWGDPGFDWKQTILFSNWAFLPLIGAAFSISIGGEIKQVARGQTLGILGAVLFSVVTFIVSFALIFRTMGSDFLGGVTFANLNGVEGAATPVTPFPTLLAGIGSGSVALTALIALGFIGWIWLWIPTQILYPTRAIVAWSLDRVAPDALGTVNERTHTPIPAIALSLAGGIGFVAVLTHTTYFNLVIFIEVAVLAWAIVLLAGVFFPYRRPDIFQKSAIANLKIRGIPVMSIACAFGCAAAGLYFANLWFDGFAAGHARHSLSILIGWWVGAFVIYWIMWFIRRRQGVKVELAFKEIPIE